MTCPLSPQIMSLEDVEKIMGDTQEAVEYQRVRPHTMNLTKHCTCIDGFGLIRLI